MVRCAFTSSPLRVALRTASWAAPLRGRVRMIAIQHGQGHSRVWRGGARGGGGIMSGRVCRVRWRVCDAWADNMTQQLFVNGFDTVRLPVVFPLFPCFLLPTAYSIPTTCNLPPVSCFLFPVTLLHSHLFAFHPYRVLVLSSYLARGTDTGFGRLLNRAQRQGNAWRTDERALPSKQHNRQTAVQANSRTGKQQYRQTAQQELRT